MPHEHWFQTQLSWMVSNCPPDISMPVPIGASQVMPEQGTFGLLLSCTLLRWMNVQEVFEVPGQRPLCGGGLSSLLSEFGRMPTLLQSHSESSMTRCPPAFVPE